MENKRNKKMVYILSFLLIILLIVIIVSIIYLKNLNNKKKNTTPPAEITSVSSVTKESTTLAETTTKKEIKTTKKAKVNTIKNNNKKYNNGNNSYKNRKHLKVPLIYQKPELPSGCEIVALTMVLRYNNFNVGKTELLKFFDFGPITTTNPNKAFLGNPRRDPGYCLEQPVINAGNRYLSSVGSPKRVIYKSGLSISQIKEYINSGTPLIVWITLQANPPKFLDKTYYSDGHPYHPYMNSHTVVISGYNDYGIEVTDSMDGNWTIRYDRFQRSYNSRGQKILIIE